MLKLSKKLDVKLSHARSILISHIKNILSRIVKREDLVPWTSLCFLIWLIKFLKIMGAWLRMVKMLVLLSELLILLINLEFFVICLSMIYQLEEMLEKSWDLFKLSNSLMNSEKYAQLLGNQAKPPWTLEMRPNLISSGKMNTLNDYQILF